MTGWTLDLMQDECRGLGQWFASRIDARETLRRNMKHETDLPVAGYVVAMGPRGKFGRVDLFDIVGWDRESESHLVRGVAPVLFKTRDRAQESIEKTQNYCRKHGHSWLYGCGGILELWTVTIYANE